MNNSQFQYKIKISNLTIYDKIYEYDSDKWIPTDQLQKILNDKLKGVDLTDYPLRTRSKYVKSKICEALGYPIPNTFQKTKPRFVGQNFDIYIQKSNNLQIWNEDIDPNRRYVLVKVSDKNLIEKVKVVTGHELAKLDKTGTLTQKYQARVRTFDSSSSILYDIDTDNLQKLILNTNKNDNFDVKPIDNPIPSQLLTTKEIVLRLRAIINTKIEYIGQDQERNRGAKIHDLICRKLGYRSFQDDGKFPDIRNQLIEIKLQTSPTIDLGLVQPDSIEPLISINEVQIRHCDVRYVIIKGEATITDVLIQKIFITPGEKFFKRFTRFEGMVINKKIQIPLPRDFF